MAGRRWTEEEDEYLRTNWGTVAVDTIAKKLNRTIYSIRKRRVSLSLLEYLESGDYVTVNKLFSLLKGNCRSFKRHKALENAGCPITMKKMRGNRPSVMVVNIDDFWAWLKNNPTMINLAFLEENALGGEDAWVKRKRLNDERYNFAPIKHTQFTPEEERQIISLAKSYRYTYDEIALRLGRSAQSIKDKMAFMGLPIRLGNLKERKLWTKEDDRQMYELIKDGFTVRGISIKLQRGEETVRGRMNVLYGTSSINSLFHMIQRGEIAC